MPPKLPHPVAVRVRRVRGGRIEVWHGHRGRQLEQTPVHPVRAPFSLVQQVVQPVTRREVVGVHAEPVMAAVTHDLVPRESDVVHHAVDEPVGRT